MVLEIKAILKCSLLGFLKSNKVPWKVAKKDTKHLDFVVSPRHSPRWHLLIFYISIDQISIIFILSFHRDNNISCLLTEPKKELIEQGAGRGVRVFPELSIFHYLRAAHWQALRKPLFFLLRKHKGCVYTDPAAPAPCGSKEGGRRMAGFLPAPRCRPVMERHRLCT